MSKISHTVHVKTIYDEIIRLEFSYKNVTPEDIAISLHNKYYDLFPYSKSKSKKGCDYTDIVLIDSTSTPHLYSAVVIYGSHLPIKVIHTASNQRVYQFELDKSPMQKISYNPQTLDRIQLDTNLFVAFLD